MSPCPAGQGALSGLGPLGLMTGTELWGAPWIPQWPRSCCRRWALSWARPGPEQPRRAGSIRVGTQNRRVCRWEPRTILHWTKQLLILFLCRGRSVLYNSQGGSYGERDIRHRKGKSHPEPRSCGEAALGRMSYGQRLREFNLYGLESQCWRGNRITLYKYLKGSCVRKGKKSDACSSRGRDVMVRSWEQLPEGAARWCSLVGSSREGARACAGLRGSSRQEQPGTSSWWP